MALPMSPLADATPGTFSGHMVVDCLFGTGLSRPLEGKGLVAIERLNQSGAFVVSADIPSGLDCDTGLPLGCAVKAARTITFVAEKLGFANPLSKAFTGSVTVVDIGCPQAAIDMSLQTESDPSLT
jgi:NAD(P)H-hydrate epimerase